jgi:glutathione synthase/RimK-type ligase-like ATP-grasp enzyme
MNTSKTLALVTYKKSPNLSPSDTLLINPLQKQGFTVIAAPWDDPNIDWTQFCGVILRSCWDYHTKPVDFLVWISHLEKNKVSLWNTPGIIRWNYDKHYLLDIAKNKTPIIPTVVIHKGKYASIAKIIHEKGWNDLIIKPVVGASAFNIFRMSKNNLCGQFRIHWLNSKTDIMIQPFLKEIYDGELSFIFIGGKYSHAVHKKPKYGNYFTNRHDASVTLYKPSLQQIAEVQNIIDLLDERLLYARIDALLIHNTLHLMEIELIEPELFFPLYPQAAETFAEACKRYI